MIHKNLFLKYLGRTKFKSLVLFCLIGLFPISLVNAQTNNPREIIPFDDGWRFWLGDDQSAKQIKFDDSKWQTLNVPHDWSIEGAVNPPPAGDRNSGYF